MAIFEDLIFLTKVFLWGGRTRATRAILCVDIRLRIRRMSAISFWVSVFFLIASLIFYIPLQTDLNIYFYSLAVFTIINFVFYILVLFFYRNIQRASISYLIFALVAFLLAIECVYMYMLAYIKHNPPTSNPWLFILSGLFLPFLFIPLLVNKQSILFSKSLKDGDLSYCLNKETVRWDSNKDHIVNKITSPSTCFEIIGLILLIPGYFIAIQILKEIEDPLIPLVGFLGFFAWWFFTLSALPQSIGFILELRRAETELGKPIILTEYGEENSSILQSTRTD